MRPALNIKKLSSDQLIEARNHEHCLKEEPAIFRNPLEKQEFRENIALLVVGLVLIIGLPILIAILAKRYKKKKTKQAYPI